MEINIMMVLICYLHSRSLGLYKCLQFVGQVIDRTTNSSCWRSYN